MAIKPGANYFPNQGFWLHEFTDEELKPLRDEIVRMHENPKNFRDYRSGLAGNISGSLGVGPTVVAYLEQLIIPIAELYEKEFDYLKQIKSHLNHGSLTMADQCWVNFQRAAEFNPIHKHSGVFSWVIWLETPYSVKDQQAMGPGYLSNTPVVGCFEFNYNTILGHQAQLHLNADIGWRNRMAIFPALLHHSVYPFYGTDQARISVSGNLVFDGDLPADRRSFDPFKLIKK
jgi:hypothetical protein